MLKLTDREWKAFFIEDQFAIKSGKRLTKAEQCAGTIPFIGASDSNNGITGFVANENESTDQNVLGVNYNGSVVETFYHPYKATFSDDVKRVTVKSLTSSDRHTLLFVKQCILQQKSKYAYGYKFNAERMRRQKILLPVTIDGVPDWEFMSAYMREQEKLMLERVLPHFKQRLLDSLLVLGATPDTEWGGVRVSDLFTITIGKNLDGNKIDKTSGSLPYVTRKETNNGVDGFTDGHSEEYLWQQVPAITIGNETAKPFVQTHAFYTGTKVNILTPKQPLPVGALKFIARCIEANKERYSYSYTANSTRLAQQRIMLPCCTDGTLNVSFMEQQIARIESDALAYVTELLETRHQELVDAVTKRGGELTDREWQASSLGQILDEIYRGSNESLDSYGNGKALPYVGATSRNNGVTGFVDYREGMSVENPNAIVFIMTGEGSVGDAVYKGECFVPSKNVAVGRCAAMDRFSGNFLVRLINCQADRYNYGYIRSMTRLKKERISLPVDSHKTIDWEFMSRYTRAQECLLLIRELRKLVN